MPDACEYVRKMYGVPAQVGMRVAVGGKRGVIVNADHHLHVEFDTGYEGRCHPTYSVTYFTEAGEVAYGPGYRL